jgi:hypothetical protein
MTNDEWCGSSCGGDLVRACNTPSRTVAVQQSVASPSQTTADQLSELTSQLASLQAKLAGQEEIKSQYMETRNRKPQGF